MKYYVVDTLTGRFSERSTWAKAASSCRVENGFHPDRFFPVCSIIPRTSFSRAELKELREDAAIAKKMLTAAQY